ncbi:LysR family transcriptional regulator [Roseibium aestuarii]|uniref:LysR family transcriptional regulator n=1 Tax=Roseibium aestuarii TaxID=2600299 RepID=A0ABW4JV62_9HYPH|nr:LysR family transcriptional regulator [Roseibium aestuarii]
MTYILDLDQLRTFLAIAELGSFSRAGEAVHKTQSAVSMQMRRLESKVGHPIFTRKGRHSALTPEGLRLVAYARRMIDLNSETLTALNNQDLRRPIHLGLPHEFADRMMAAVIASFARLHPVYDVRVTCCTREEAEAAVRAGALDLALLVAVDAEALAGRVVRSEPLHWVGSLDHGALALRKIRLILAEEGCPWRAVALEQLQQAERPHEIAYQCACAPALFGPLGSGLGITVLPESAIREGLRILDDTDELPRLPQCHVSLFARENASHAGLLALDRHIRAAIGNSNGLDTDPEPGPVRPVRNGSSLQAPRPH